MTAGTSQIKVADALVALMKSPLLENGFLFHVWLLVVLLPIQEIQVELQPKRNCNPRWGNRDFS